MGNSACEPLHHRRPASVVRRTQRLGPCPLRGCPGAQELLDHRDLDAFACGFQQVACMPVHVRTGRQQQCNGRSIASIARVPERHVDMHCIGASRQQHRHDASVTSATRSHKRTIRSIWVAASADTGCEEPLDNWPRCTQVSAVCMLWRSRGRSHPTRAVAPEPRGAHADMPRPEPARHRGGCQRPPRGTRPPLRGRPASLPRPVPQSPSARCRALGRAARARRGRPWRLPRAACWWWVTHPRRGASRQ